MKEHLKLNQTIEFGLKREVITEVSTQIGYLQVLEYILHDKSFLHIVNYNYYRENDENNLPKFHSKSFHRQKDIALKYAEEITKDLLKQY